MEGLHKLYEIPRARFAQSPLLTSLLSRVCVALRTRGHLFYTLGYNPLLLYLVVQVIPTLVTGRSFG